MRPTSPLRHGSQQGSVSAKDQALCRLFEDDVRTRFARRTGEHYTADTQLFLGWLQDQGLALGDIRASDVQRYQGELYARRKSDGHPYAAATVALRLIAVKTFFRFLLKRGHLLFDPPPCQ